VGAVTTWVSADIADQFMIGPELKPALLGVAVGAFLMLFVAWVYDRIIVQRRKQNSFVPPPRRGD
jgi:hypothetical protein